MSARDRRSSSVTTTCFSFLLARPSTALASVFISLSSLTTPLSSESLPFRLRRSESDTTPFRMGKRGKRTRKGLKKRPCSLTIASPVSSWPRKSTCSFSSRSDSEIVNMSALCFRPKQRVVYVFPSAGMEISEGCWSMRIIASPSSRISRRMMSVMASVFVISCFLRRRM